MPSSVTAMRTVTPGLGPDQQAEQRREEHAGADRPEARAIGLKNQAMRDHQRDAEEAGQRQRPVPPGEPVELVESEQRQGGHEREEDEAAVDHDDDGEHGEDDAGDDARRHDAPPSPAAPLVGRGRARGRRNGAGGRRSRPAPRRGPRPEVGPQPVAEVQLGVGALPEQEVADAQLPGGADQQLRVVHLGCVEVAAEVVVGELGTRRRRGLARRAASAARPSAASSSSRRPP